VHVRSWQAEQAGEVVGFASFCPARDDDLNPGCSTLTSEPGRFTRRAAGARTAPARPTTTSSTSRRRAD
jgi:hypothetical protein